ncbi:MAG: YbaK/EbsC family protein [Candidatus Omnitrophica bacterium]|nr:YbaK/EbsC family protein [Candidatus Omnitrophota bacterium]MCB9720418.1 YbaK/EbsC family protein [Candidatus Omnitrophota bacterium]
MSISSRLRKLLDGHQIHYQVIHHAQAFTAPEIAETAHESGKEFAKTVVCNVDGVMKMIVLPAHEQVDLRHLAEVFHAGSVVLATETELAAMFPDCEVGAMPPFGEIYGLEVMVDEHLAGNDLISFNAGNHREIIKMRYIDFDRLIKPKPVKVVRIVV